MTQEHVWFFAAAKMPVKAQMRTKLSKNYSEPHEHGVAACLGDEIPETQ